MKILSKSIFWYRSFVAVICAGVAGGSYFLIRNAVPVKDGQVQTSSAETHVRGHGPRSERTSNSVSYREISYTLEEIATSYQGRDKEQMLFDFVKLSSGKHTDLVFRYAVERNDPGMAEALGHCLGCLGTGNWIPWIKELKPDALREALVRGYIRGLGSVTMVTAFKAQEDPLLAARFLESLPPNKINSRYYAYLAGQWYQQDGLAASKWVSELPTGREKDTAIMILTSEIAAGDPATARTWAESISDEFLRAKALQAVETRQGK